MSVLRKLFALIIVPLTLLTACQQTAEAPPVTAKPGIVPATLTSPAIAAEKERVLPCVKSRAGPTEHESVLVGRYDITHKSGAKIPYCLTFYPDGTMLVRDSDQEIAARWEVTSSGVISWKATESYQYPYSNETVPLSPFGTITGVTMSADNLPAAHLTFSWEAWNRYGRNNFKHAFEGNAYLSVPKTLRSAGRQPSNARSVSPMRRPVRPAERQLNRATVSAARTIHRTGS